MNRSIVIALLLLIGLPAHGQAFKEALAPLVEASCIDCHDADTKTVLNFGDLGFDLADADTYDAWEKVLSLIHI